jgi:hypothetical protein
VLGCQFIDTQVMTKVDYGFKQIHFLYEPLACGALLHHCSFPQILVASLCLTTFCKTLNMSFEKKSMPMFAQRNFKTFIVSIISSEKANQINWERNVKIQEIFH